MFHMPCLLHTAQGSVISTDPLIHACPMRKLLYSITVSFLPMRRTPSQPHVQVCPTSQCRFLTHQATRSLMDYSRALHHIHHPQIRSAYDHVPPGYPHHHHIFEIGTLLSSLTLPPSLPNFRSERSTERLYQNFPLEPSLGATKTLANPRLPLWVPRRSVVRKFVMSISFDSEQ